MHPGSRQTGTRILVLFARISLSLFFLFPLHSAVCYFYSLRGVSTPPQFADVVLRPLPVRLEGPARFLLEAITLSPALPGSLATIFVWPAFESTVRTSGFVASCSLTPSLCVRTSCYPTLSTCHPDNLLPPTPNWQARAKVSGTFWGCSVMVHVVHAGLTLSGLHKYIHSRVQMLDSALCMRTQIISDSRTRSFALPFQKPC